MSITTSEVTVSVTVDDRRRLPAIVEALSEFAEVEAEHDMAIVCVVGEGAADRPALIGQVLQGVGDVPIRLVSQAASRRNVTFVIREADLAARAHAGCISSSSRRAGAGGARLMRVLLVGHGRMGQLVEALAPEYGAVVAGVVTAREAERALRRGRFRPGRRRHRLHASPTRSPATCRCSPRRGVNVVSARPGGRRTRRELRDVVAQTGNRRARRGELLARHEPVSARRRGRRAPLRQAPVVRRLDSRAAPRRKEGRALRNGAAAEGGDGTRRLRACRSTVSSVSGRLDSRARMTVGFDGPSDTITLTHTVRDRAVFARGALEAARWLEGQARMVHDARYVGDEIQVGHGGNAADSTA